MQTGQVKEEQEVHSGQINDIRFSADGTHFVTASADMTAKLIDTLSLEVCTTAVELLRSLRRSWT